jgi:hypothetical protein
MVTVYATQDHQSLLFLETGSHYEAQAGLELTILIFNLSSAGITGVNHHTWLAVTFFFLKKNDKWLLGKGGQTW